MHNMCVLEHLRPVTLPPVSLVLLCAGKVALPGTGACWLLWADGRWARLGRGSGSVPRRACPGA